MTKTNRPKVIVTYSEVPEKCIQILEEKCDVIKCGGKPMTNRSEILAKIKGADGIYWATDELLNVEVLNAAGPQLKVISTHTSGLNHVDIPELKKRGILLGHAPGIMNDAVADIAIGLMIAAARRFHEGYLKIVNHEWDARGPQWMLGQDIKNSTIGIVGLGGIGQAICRRVQALCVSTVLYSGNGEKPEGKKLGAHFVSFDELLNRSDFVIVACPLTAATKNMFDQTAFRKMKPTSVFVNVGRGGIVDHDDLIRALKNGTIFSAGLDVTVPEPLPSDHPLTKLPNCVLLPHIGTLTTNTRENMSVIAVQNVINGLEGRPLVRPAYFSC